MDTSTYHYKSRRREQAGIEARIREICGRVSAMAIAGSTFFFAVRAGRST
jgi:transcription elongation GreA/GreB family factor